MNICMVVEHYPPLVGGGGTAVYELSNRLSKTHKITVITYHAKNQPVVSLENEITVVRFGNAKVTFFLRTFLYLISKNQFDIYHAHGTFCGLIAKIISLFKKKPVILHLHGYRDKKTVNIIKYKIQNFIIKSGFDKIISADSYAINQVEKLGITAEQLVQIKFGVDTDKFRPSDIGNQRKNILLFVGRLVKVKGLNTLLQAMNLLKNEDIELWIAGKGEMETELKEYSSMNNLKVKFLGELTQNELSDHYRKSKFLVLPSISEGQGLVLLEALASGVPIIVSDIPSLRETAEHCGAGFIFEKGSSEDLAKKILMCSSIDTINYSELKGNARVYAENFSWEKAADSINMIYLDISD